MGETAIQLNRKIGEARELRSLVRMMKAAAAAGIWQYENAVNALNDYYHSVEQGLGLCLRKNHLAALLKSERKGKKARSICVIIFGTDQGLVGRFNDDIIDYSIKILTPLPKPPQIWTVGQHIYSRIQESGLMPVNVFDTPISVQGITQLASQILMEASVFMREGEITEVHLIYNRMTADAIYTVARQRLLPFDRSTLAMLADQHWPTKKIPEIVGDEIKVLRGLIREYLFVSLYKACAESLVSENSTRLAAMQRADKNIDEMLRNLQKEYNYLRQSSIDAELFDLVSSYEASGGKT